MELVYPYKKLRRDFGKKCSFVDCKPELLANIQPNEELSQNFIPREIVETACQCACEMSEHEVNTVVIENEPRGCNHTEGGWPKDVDPKSIEHVTRFRKKAERVEGFISAVANLAPSVLHCIKQNNAIDIYEDYFEDVSSIQRAPSPTAKTVVTIRDPHDVKRPVSHISWSPFGGRKLAVAHCQTNFCPTGFTGSLNSYIWNVEEFNAPEMKIKPVSPLLCLEYNPKDPTLLAGGCYNGQILFWDTRRGSSSIHMTPPAKSHRDPVYNVLWLHSKSGTECFSASTDGKICWWDTRNLSEPYETLTVPSYRSPGAVDGVVCIDFDTSMPTKFLMGTEDGSIMTGNRKAKMSGDRIMNVYPGHIGPVYAVHRHPFFPKFFLSVADWTAKIWSEDFKEALISSPTSRHYLTDGCWSPVRPGIFFSSTVNGKVDIWDMLVKHSSPVLTVRVSESSVNKLRLQEQGKLLASGSGKGTTTILELSEDLSTIQQDEKHLIAAMFERQCKQGKALENRTKTTHRRVTVKQDTSFTKNAPSEPEDRIKAVEEEFFQVLKFLQKRKTARRTAQSGDAFDMDESITPPRTMTPSPTHSVITEENEDEVSS